MVGDPTIWFPELGVSPTISAYDSQNHELGLVYCIYPVIDCENKTTAWFSEPNRFSPLFLHFFFFSLGIKPDKSSTSRTPNEENSPVGIHYQVESSNFHVSCFKFRRQA